MDMVLDVNDNIYSAIQFGTLLMILKQDLLGVKVWDKIYGNGGGDILLGAMEYTSSDGEAIYLTGGAYGNSYTSTSTTYNMILHKIKPSDGSTVFMKHWGLDATG